MFFQKFVLTFAFAFSLICLEHGEELNYLMINILELSPNNADGNDSNAINCSHEADSSMTVLPTALGEGDGSSQAPPYDIGNTTAEPPLGQLGTDSSPEDPSTLKPTTTEESVTTFPTETPIQPLCFPDVCSRVINITWLSLPPFIFQLETGKQPEKFDDSITGVFYSIIGRAIQFCCKYLGKRGTRLQYTHSARNRDTLHGNIFHGEASMGLPVYIEDELFDHTYGGKLAFIKVLESPGLVLIANKENAIDNDLRVLWKAIFNEWPIVLISLLLCAISGICVWALDTTWNAEEFPRRFHRGAFEGFWWAFVTMSTVGYGDKAPKSVIARLFCIIWIMVGLTVCSVMTATLTAALAAAPGRDVELVGKKIAVLKGSPAFKDVVKRGGNPQTFDSFEDMHKALVQNNTVSGIMDEMYSGLYWMEQVRDSRLHVAKVIERTRSYGFTFKHDDIFTWPVEDCIRNLILNRGEDVYAVMKLFMDEIGEKLSDVVGDDDVIVIAGNSPAFRAIVISLTILLGALTGAILLCQFVVYLYQRIVTGNRTEDKQGGIGRKTSVHSPTPRNEVLEI